MAEKDYDYETKCEEIAKDYKLHPENYEDVTFVTPDGLGHYYVDKEGFDWTFETEGLPYSKLEAEGVYMIFDELKFVRRKADSR